MGICDIFQCKENNYQYDFIDLSYDNNKLFSRAFLLELEHEIDKYNDDDIYIREISRITALQWEVSNDSVNPTNAQKFDIEIAKIKNELLWNSIATEDRIDTIFWQDGFEAFVSFTKRTNRVKMVYLLEISSFELKQAGFTPDYISKIITVIREWAEIQLNPDTSEIELSEQSHYKTHATEYGDISAKILSMFFNEDK